MNTPTLMWLAQTGSHCSAKNMPTMFIDDGFIQVGRLPICAQIVCQLSGINRYYIPLFPLEVEAAPSWCPKSFLSPYPPVLSSYSIFVARVESQPRVTFSQRRTILSKDLYSIVTPNLPCYIAFHGVHNHSSRLLSI
ncbi:uncharacterized protein BDZ99DRAFT_61415 [Mytilinidion resinicola]|uniref:Uncharacterized protein n=1 Tax=Mytilinidion resinicola TaxID=574789 RepID=A0A6A6YGA6_9PEZI|nr:uncharacterized protein BDZ99DRAFT_61415 [Mytilinidion resinicola]KAF2807608.1 hypothetical protein BDZ99DRAFT_61415 [Mytilinidion resinicola]